MSILYEEVRICPKCGSFVIWGSWGALTSDPEQFMATCHSCGYHAHKYKFPKAKYTADQENDRSREIKEDDDNIVKLLKLQSGYKYVEKPIRKSFIKRLIERLWGK